MHITVRKVITTWLVLGALSYVLSWVFLKSLALSIYFINMGTTIVLSVKLALSSKDIIGSWSWWRIVMLWLALLVLLVVMALLVKVVEIFLIGPLTIAAVVVVPLITVLRMLHRERDRGGPIDSLPS